MFLPNGILGGLARPGAAPEGPAVSADRTVDARSQQELRLARRRADVEIELAARRTLRADRPERRRQDDADQPDHRHAAAGFRADLCLATSDITALAPEERVRRGLVRTFQINSLFPHLTALESVTLAVCERRRVAQTWWRPLTAYRERDRRGLCHSGRAGLGAGVPPADP